EAGVMPRTSHCVLDHDALGERSAVMGTNSADREVLVASACEEDAFFSHMAGNHAPVGKVVDRNAERKVWPGCVWLRRAHHVPQRGPSPALRRAYWQAERQSRSPGKPRPIRVSAQWPHLLCCAACE